MPDPETQGHRNAQSIRVQRGQATCLRSHSRMCVIPRQWRSTGSGPGKRGTTNKAAAVPPCIGPGAPPLPAGNSLGQTMSFGPWSVTRSTVAASEQKSRAASWFHLCSLPSAAGTPSPRWDVLLGPQSQKAPRTEPQVTQKDTAWEPQNQPSGLERRGQARLSPARLCPRCSRVTSGNSSPSLSLSPGVRGPGPFSTDHTSTWVKGAGEAPRATTRAHTRSYVSLPVVWLR